MKSIVESIKESLIEEGKLIKFGKYKAWIKDWNLAKVGGIPITNNEKVTSGVLLNFDRDKNPDFRNSLEVQVIFADENKDCGIDGGKIVILEAREISFDNIYRQSILRCDYHLKWLKKPDPDIKDLIDDIIKEYN